MLKSERKNISLTSYWILEDQPHTCETGGMQDLSYQILIALARANSYLAIRDEEYGSMERGHLTGFTQLSEESGSLGARPQLRGVGTRFSLELVQEHNSVV